MLRQPGEIICSQADPATSVFYMQEGQAKLTVVSPSGKEGTLSLLTQGDFVGEEALISKMELRITTATALTPCSLLEIKREVMLGAMHESQSLSDLFLAFLLARNQRLQADLLDHLFNSSEKRLARTLLLMAEANIANRPDEALLPPITQEMLAEMIGTTRSRVNFFMNRFRKLGFIEYKGRIRVNRTKLNLVLYD